jgi:inner membrane transporter RhtA
VANLKKITPFCLCITSMLLMQIGLALSLPVIHSLGAIHTSAYRLSVAAFVTTCVCLLKRRDKLRQYFTLNTIILGIAMAGMAIFFSIAIANMPLALATCIEFMGPLAVVCAYNKSIRSMILVLSALLGIYLMLANPQEQAPVSQIWSAFSAAACWAAYIIFGKRASESELGIYSICPALIVAALTSLIASVWESSIELSNIEIPRIFMIAGLYPLAPYILDLLALKSLKQSIFGMLTSAEPMIALAIGVLTLGQTLTYFQVAGLSLVVFANAASISKPDRANEA